MDNRINQSLLSLKSVMLCPLENPFTFTGASSGEFNAQTNFILESVNAYLDQFPPCHVFFTTIAVMSVVSLLYPRVSNFIASMTFMHILKGLVFANLEIREREMTNPIYIYNLVAISAMLVAYIYASVKFIRKAA